jgi:hypothetical protein
LIQGFRLQPALLLRVVGTCSTDRDCGLHCPFVDGAALLLDGAERASYGLDNQERPLRLGI